LGYEASVCGGIPIIKSLKEGLASNDISQFMGIVNGTCNYILTAMSRESKTFSDTLKQAQVLGYAEQNPALDVEGVDSAHKLAILGRLSFKNEVDFKSIYTEGISNLSKTDIDYAKELGYVIKLLAIGKKRPDGLELRVHPTLIAQDHPLANVRGVYNAVFIHGDQADDILFYGKGAGMLPTASAVMSDIIDIAKRISGWKDMAASSRPTLEEGKVLPIEAIHSKYYLRFQVADKPGVLGRIAQTLGNHKISILSVHQKEAHNPKSVPVVILTYEASEKNLRAALKRIDGSSDVRQKTVLIRVEK
jgi:homoserine dehydrogenase